MIIYLNSCFFFKSTDTFIINSDFHLSSPSLNRSISFFIIRFIISKNRSLALIDIFKFLISSYCVLFTDRSKRSSSTKCFYLQVPAFCFALHSLHSSPDVGLEYAVSYPDVGQLPQFVHQCHVSDPFFLRYSVIFSPLTFLFSWHSYLFSSYFLYPPLKSLNIEIALCCIAKMASAVEVVIKFLFIFPFL